MSTRQDLRKKISSADFQVPFLIIVWALGDLFLWLSGLFNVLTGRVGAMFVLIVNPFLKSILGDNLLSALLILALNLAVLIGALIIFFWWVPFALILIFGKKRKN